MPANNELQWTVGIIAQVQDELSDFEYNAFEKTIKKRSDDVYLNYVIFYFNQGTKKSQIKILNKYKDDFDTTDISGDDALYNKNELINFLKNNIAGKSDRYMLITWGHGAGLGFFAHDDNDKESNKGGNSTGTKPANAYLIQLSKEKRYNPTREIRKDNRKYGLISQHIANSSFRPEAFSDEGEELKKILDSVYTSKNLAEILQQSFGTTKIHLFIANSCFMNTFETGCTLMNQVEIYAAPQTIVPFAGIDYDRLFAALEDNPDLNMTELAQEITDNYAPKYTAKNSFTKEFKLKRKYINIRELTISVNSLSAFKGDKENKNVEKRHKGVIDCINRFGNHLVKLLQIDARNGNDNYRRKIDIARSFCGDFTHSANYIDFTNFFCELLKSFQDEDPGELKNIYYDFYWAKEQTVLSIYSSERLFSFMPEYFYSQSPQMFSIYFPQRTGRTKLQEKFIKEYYETTFTGKGFGWIEFLKTYLS
jgi:hypothetical protein